MGRRTLLLVAALFLAAVGTGVLFVSARGVATTSRASAGQVDVLAPAQEIPGGTAVTAQTPLVTVKVSTEAAQQGRMIRQRSELKDMVANRDLLPFLPLTIDQFGGAVSQTSKIEVDPGLMAVTVDIGDPNRVADLLVGGSRVAIWVIINPEGGGRSEARLFMSNVKVLTTGTSGTIRSSSTQAPQENGSTALVTLQVDQKQAGELLVAQAAGDLYFTLLSGDAEPTEQAYNEDALVPNG